MVWVGENRVCVCGKGVLLVTCGGAEGCFDRVYVGE